MPLSTMDRSSSQKIIKETLGLNYIVDKMDLTNIYNIPHNCSRMHILCKCTWNILQDTTYVRSQNKPWQCKKMEIIPGIFSSHSGMKLEINNRRKTGKFTDV